MLTIASSVAAAAAEPEALATQQDLHKLFEAGQYQPLLQKLTRVLQLKGNAAAAYDRVDLYVLRGEAFLQLKQQSRAMESFQLAAKELNTPSDPKAPARDAKLAEEQRRAVRAITLLASRSTSFQYVPKTRAVAAPGAPAAPTAPISILDLTQRKAAYQALLTDVKAELAPKAKSATAGKTLVPVVDLVRQLGDLRAVEQAATGATTDTDKLLDELADHARGLMADEVDRLDKRTDRISTVANEHIPIIDLSPSYNSGTRFKLKGLEVQDQKDLKEAIDTCGKIAAVAHDFADVGSASTAPFQKIQKDADKAGDKARDVLNTDYNKIFIDPKKTK